jgi:hypothetical protein
MMNCDPPTIACSDRVTSGAVALIGTADFQWDNQCDRCGAYDTPLTPTMLRLGHMTISAHVRTRGPAAATSTKAHTKIKKEEEVTSTDIQILHAKALASSLRH